ncbi:Ig-like domain-containing protein [Streptomyces chartreusis]|uniref:Ig-like domain-containing protein n=1 Tax=Streptomyces chartreusis TaxID=1969 RepID=UPI003645DF0D
MRITPREGRLVVATALAAVLGLASPAWAVPSSTTVTARPQFAAIGSPVQLQVTIDCPEDPTGGLGVTFYDGGVPLNDDDGAPVNANGQAEYTATFTTTGTHTVTAAYNGNANCDASSGTTTVQIMSAPLLPGLIPGPCLLLCNGLISHSVDITNTVNHSGDKYFGRKPGPGDRRHPR